LPEVSEQRFIGSNLGAFFKDTTGESLDICDPEFGITEIEDHQGSRTPDGLRPAGRQHSYLDIIPVGEFGQPIQLPGRQRAILLTSLKHCGLHRRMTVSAWIDAAESSGG
jgi:hypothetical protein